MTTTTEALQALVSELEAAAVYAAVSAASGTNATEANMRNLDARRAALASALAEVVKDAERLDWLFRQDLQDLTLQFVVDAPNDGCYFVAGDAGDGYGKTPREAIDAARSAEQKGV